MHIGSDHASMSHGLSNTALHLLMALPFAPAGCFYAATSEHLVYW
jgi:hypothetical protein